MISPEWLHPFEWRIPGVNGIMHAAIHEVTENKPGEEHECVGPHDEIHQSKNGRGNDDTRNRRHEQTLTVSWIMMMITMKNVRKIFNPWIIAYPMKNETMCDVFKKTPEKYSTNKCENDFCGGITNIVTTVIKHVCNDGKINSPDDKRMCFGQHFKIFILE